MAPVQALPRSSLVMVKLAGSEADRTRALHSAVAGVGSAVIIDHPSVGSGANAGRREEQARALRCWRDGNGTVVADSWPSFDPATRHV